MLRDIVTSLELRTMASNNSQLCDETIFYGVRMKKNWRQRDHKHLRCFAFFGYAAIILFADPIQTISKASLFSSAHAGTAIIGGKRMSCRAAKVVINNKSPYIAYAEAGKIVLNRNKLRRYPATTQRVIFLHECAHQYVGYDETEADCWAVRYGKNRGWLSAKGISTVCRSFYNDPGSYAHLPGPARCEAMRVCFNNTKTRKRRAKKTR